MEVKVVEPPPQALTLTRLTLLNSIVCGVEFCASAAFCYIPPMLLKSGMSEEKMSLVMGIGPLLCFLLVPIIGRASDRCRSRYGRRRPFIFALSMLLLASLMIVPYGHLFGSYLFGNGVVGKNVGMLLVIFGTVVIDFASLACLTPCEALLSDVSRGTDLHSKCFMVYSFMVSFGGCIGYLITALDWNSYPIGVYFGTQERSAFTLLFVLFLVSMVATFAVANERPYVPDPIQEAQERAESLQSSQELMESKIQENMDLIRRSGPSHDCLEDGLSAGRKPHGPNDAGYESGGNHSPSDERDRHNNFLISACDNPNVNSPCAAFDERNCNIPLTKLTVTSVGSLADLCYRRVYHLLPDTAKALLRVPFVLKRLWLANFCSWTAVMAFNVYFTDFVGQSVYGGNPNGEEDSQEAWVYDYGVRMGSWGLLFHCITAAMYAPCVQRLTARFGIGACYCMGMFTFAVSMTVTAFSSNIYLVLLMASCTGIGYSTLTTIPFMMVTIYHEHKEVFFHEALTPKGVSVNRGVGSDMATLDSAYFLSQVVLSAFMGYIVHWTGTTVAYVVLSSVMGIVACVCIGRVVYTREEMQLLIKHSTCVY